MNLKQTTKFDQLERVYKQFRNYLPILTTSELKRLRFHIDLILEERETED